MLHTSMSLEQLALAAEDIAISIVDIVPHAAPLLDRLDQNQIEQFYGALPYLNEFNPFEQDGEILSEAELLSLSDQLYQEFLGEYGNGREAIGRMAELMSRGESLSAEEEQELNHIRTFASLIHREVLRRRYINDCRSFCEGIYGWRDVFFRDFDGSISTLIDLDASDVNLHPADLIERDRLENRYMSYIDAVASSLVSLYEEHLTIQEFGLGERIFDSLREANDTAIRSVGRFLLYHFLP